MIHSSMSLDCSRKPAGHLRLLGNHSVEKSNDRFIIGSFRDKISSLRIWAHTGVSIGKTERVQPQQTFRSPSIAQPMDTSGAKISGSVRSDVETEIEGVQQGDEFG